MAVACGNDVGNDDVIYEANQSILSVKENPTNDVYVAIIYCDNNM